MNYNLLPEVRERTRNLPSQISKILCSQTRFIQAWQIQDLGLNEQFAQ